jgi:hypothetical protein
MVLRSTTLRLIYVLVAFTSLAGATPSPSWYDGGGWYGGGGGGPGGAFGNDNPGAFFNGGDNGGDDNGGDFGGLNAFRSGINFNAAARARMAHAVLASLAFVIFFPSGAIAVRILPGRLAVLVHFVLQIFGYLVFIAAAGLGLWVATTVRFGNFDLVSYRPDPLKSA